MNNESLSQYAGRRYPLNYTEVYAGIIGDHLSAHFHYSPNYFRPGVNSGYADIDGVLRPADKWRLFGHVGTTFPIGEAARLAPAAMAANAARVRGWDMGGS